MKHRSKMEENGVMVNYEWAYKEVMLSHDFTEKSPAWVHSFVEGWREGYLKGYLIGRTEGKLDVLCRMKRAGMPSDKIAKYTNISLDLVEAITVSNESSVSDWKVDNVNGYLPQNTAE